jgi:hypothetical protein
MRFLICLSLVCAAQAQPPGSDPIFGMTLDTGKVHFEQAPAIATAHCTTLKELRTKKFWIFAHAKIDQTDYFVLSNRTTEVSGVGLLLHVDECVEWGADSLINGETTLPGSKDVLPKWAPLNDAVLKTLANDAFRRYSQAFGSKKAFLDALQKGGLPPKEMPRVFREELVVFSKN